MLTVLHAGGKFGGDASGYAVSGGLHGVGLSVVNALSRELHVEVWRGGTRHAQSFSRGTPHRPLAAEPAAAGDEARRGTRVRFLYDDQIFAKRWGVECSLLAETSSPAGLGGESAASAGPANGLPLTCARPLLPPAPPHHPCCLALCPCSAIFDPDTIRSRLQELAFLNSGAAIHFRATPMPPPRQRGSASSGNGADAQAAAGAEQQAPEWELFQASGALDKWSDGWIEAALSPHNPALRLSTCRRAGRPPR